MTGLRAKVLLAAACLLVLAACGSTSTTPGKHAAEPATSPVLSRTPAGTVVPVAPLPQGITYDPTTNLVAVAVHDPYRLLLLDGDTLEVRTSVPLPGKARHLTDAAPGGPVLVPDETSDTLIEVSLPGGQVRSTPVGHHPHNAIAEKDGGVLVADEFSRSISRVRDGRVVGTASNAGQPGGLVEDGDTLAVVDVRGYAVKTFDRASLRPTGQITVGAGPTHGVMTTGHRMVVADTRGGRLYVVGLDPLKVLGTYDLPGSPYGLTSDPKTGNVWVTLTGRNLLVGLSLATNTPVEFARYDTVRQPDTVAVAPGGRTLWVTGTRDGVLQRIAR